MELTFMLFIILTFMLFIILSPKLYFIYLVGISTIAWLYGT
jgi:hypothetical protein